MADTPDIVISSSGAVNIAGLKQFVAALREVDRKYPERLRKNNIELAEEVNRLSKREAATYLGQNKVLAKAAESLRARSMGGAAVIEGGQGAPYFFGAEFGAYGRYGWYASYRFRNERGRQFLKWRGNQWKGWDGGPGYFIHPTIRDNADQLLNEYANKVESLYRIAFPD